LRNLHVRDARRANRERWEGSPRRSDAFDVGVTRQSSDSQVTVAAPDFIPAPE